MPETAAEICEKPEVKQELARATGQGAGEKIGTQAKHTFIFLPHALVLLGCAIIYYLVGTRLIPLLEAQADITRRVLRGAALIVVVLAISKAVKVYAVGKIEDAVTRFTLQRIQHLVVGILVALIAISVIFVNW